jgi:hypothetical protein
MATTRKDRVGRVRERLAAMLDELGFDVDPSDLDSQYPVYATAQWDCCSWSGRGYSRAIKQKYGLSENGSGNLVHFASWSTMTECVRKGITVSKEDHAYEVSPKE